MASQTSDYRLTQALAPRLVALVVAPLVLQVDREAVLWDAEVDLAHALLCHAERLMHIWSSRTLLPEGGGGGDF